MQESRKLALFELTSKLNGAIAITFKSDFMSLRHGLLCKTCSDESLGV